MTDPHTHWSLHFEVLGPLAGYAGIYAWRFRRARREAGGRGAGWPQALAFSLAVVALLAAVASPIDGLGEDYLFSMHMTQHILLGDIAPALLLLSLSRVILRPATRRLQAIERALGRFAHPATGLGIWFAFIYFWHIPALYVAALEHPFVHGIEHLSFFTAGIALWWPLIQPVPMRRGLRGLWTFGYIGVAKLGLGALGIFLAWSNVVAYDSVRTYGTLAVVHGVWVGCWWLRFSGCFGKEGSRGGH